MIIKSRLTASILLSCIILTSHLQAQFCPKWGPYVGAKQMGGNAELMMADVMIPASGNTSFTYTCAIQFGLGKSGGYCGLQHADSKDTTRPFNNIFSVWDFPAKVQIMHTYKDPITYVSGFGNEGTGLHSHADFGWKPDNWYTNVIRRWSTGGDKTYIAYFIYDQTQKEWRQYVTFAVPEANAMLHGDISGFLENFADDTKHARTSYYKSHWKMDSAGNWIKPKILDANAGEGNWKSEPYGQDGVKLTACGKEMINGKQQIYTVTSADTKPAILSVAEIYDVAAYYSQAEKKVYANWSIKKSKGPQLSYEVSIYGTRDTTAKPLSSITGMGPEIREAVLNLDNTSKKKKDYYVVVKIKDIFNQYSNPFMFTLSELVP